MPRRIRNKSDPRILERLNYLYILVPSTEVVPWRQ